MIGSIDKPRPAPLWLLLLLLASVVGSYVITNLWFVPSRIWEATYDATGGLVHPTLIGGMVSIVVEVLLVLFLIGRFRPGEVGLAVSKLPAAFVYTLVVWGTVQLLAVALSATEGQVPRIAGSWQAGGASFEIGKLMGQLGGNAMVEELVFRGFLLGQCIVFCRRWVTDRRYLCVLAAVLVCSVLFALSHIPNRLMKDTYTGAGPVLIDQAKLLILGCVFCWLYLRTRNLLFVVGTHALLNRPTMLVAMPERFATGAEAACLFAAVVVAAGWRRTPRRSSLPTPDDP